MEFPVNAVVGLVILAFMAVAVVGVYVRPQLSRIKVRGRAQKVANTARRRPGS
jgi:hypothetical protein